MIKKSLFKASFEESLNLEDDGFVQYQKKDVYGKLEKYYKRGYPSIGLKIQSVILALIFPISLNFMLLVISIYLHDSNPKDLAVLLKTLFTYLYIRTNRSFYLFARQLLAFR